MTAIRLSCVFGALSVILGAFGAHGLREILSPDLMDIYKTAVLYMMIHALALLGSGLFSLHYPQTSNTTAFLFTAGILFFSGSLFILCLTGLRWLGAITPIGGILFILGWISFLVTTFKANRAE